MKEGVKQLLANNEATLPLSGSKINLRGAMWDDCNERRNDAVRKS